MQVRKEELEILFNYISSELGEPLSHAKFFDISDAINNAFSPEEAPEIKQSYLYNMYSKVSKAVEGTMLKVGEAYLDKIARSMGERSFATWRVKHCSHINLSPSAHESPISLNRKLLACQGNWISYARSNMNNGRVLCAPVKVFQKGAKMWIELQGETRLYQGEMRLKEGNLFMYLDGEGDKELSIILRIGSRLTPKVMKGVFCAISAGGDPISGREVWVKVEDALPKWKALSLESCKENPELLHPKLIKYFANYHENMIKVGKSTNCDWDDFD